MDPAEKTKRLASLRKTMKDTAKPMAPPVVAKKPVLVKPPPKKKKGVFSFKGLKGIFQKKNKQLEEAAQ